MKKVIYLWLSFILVLCGCGNKKYIQEIENTNRTIYLNKSATNFSEIIEDRDIVIAQKDVVTPTPLPIPIERDEIITISMVGDNLIHSPIYKNAKQEDGSYNFTSIFENIRDDIENSDISIINQETILISDYSLISSYPCFGTPSEMGEYIVSSGFDIVAHATNHTYDKKEKGILQTLEYWDTNYPDITYLGIHKDEEDYNTIKTYECKGVTFSLVNYTYGLNGFVLPKDKPYLVDLLTNEEKFISDLKNAEEIGDITICILHVGEEYVFEPTTYEKKMVELAIDNGADIVFCSHPHVLEPYEILTTKNGNQGLVYYSLGNFISNQDAIYKLLGGMAKVELDVHYIDDEVSNIEIVNYDLIPLITHYTSSGYYTTYKLEDYTNELANEHKIKRSDSRFSIEYLDELYNKIMNWET